MNNTAPGFDLDGYLGNLGRPKQFFPHDPGPDPEPMEFPQGTPNAGPTSPEPDRPGPTLHQDEDEAAEAQERPRANRPPSDQDAEDRYMRRGRVYAKTWNRLSGGVAAYLAGNPDKYPPALFMLSADEQEEMAASLAEGMREGKVPEAPWWAPLAAVVGVQIGTAVPVVIAARAERNLPPEKQLSDLAERIERERNAAPVANKVKDPVAQPPAPGTPAAQSMPPRVATKRRGRPTKVRPLCQYPGCTQRVKKKGRKYCSVEHANKAAEHERTKTRTTANTAQLTIE